MLSEKSLEIKTNKYWLILTYVLEIHLKLSSIYISVNIFILENCMFAIVKLYQFFLNKSIPQSNTIIIRGMIKIQVT